MKSHVIPVILLLVVSLCGCQSDTDEPFDTDEPQPHYEKIDVIGETAVNGVYDPSIEYHNGTGWMAYSAVEAPKYVHTRLAKTIDNGKTWVLKTTINKAVDDTVLIDDTPVDGVWRHEVPALVYDPEDPGREWKLYWHKYFTRPPYEAEDRVFHYGWIAYKYAPTPEGPWSQEIPLFGAGVFPPEPFETVINLNELHKDVREFIVYTEPGILYRDGILYMSLNGHVIKEGRNIGNVFLIASHDHGDTWEYVNMLLTPDDAQQFDSLYFTGSSLAEENNRVFLLASPEDPSSQMHHRGTCIFEFTDIKNGRLKRDKTSLIVHKYLRPTRMSGGQSDYDEQNTYGGIVMPQRDISDYPEVFQMFNTKERIV
jgi:hypothetical protein